MQLIAIKTHNYPPRIVRQAGQEYEATDGDAVVLVGAKLAKRSEPKTPVRYETKELNAEPTAKAKPKRKKRQYRRKDMTPVE